MCGILAILNSSVPSKELRKEALALSKKQRHRGPDWGGCTEYPNTILCHERLAINGVSSGVQPILDKSGKIALATNGEIYNYEQLYSDHGILESDRTTLSDCEVILHLYLRHGSETPKYLNGQFAFVLYDSRTGAFLAARDPVGIVSMYYGTSEDGSVWFSSEMKGLKCDNVKNFPPGHVFDGKGLRPYYQPVWYDEKWLPMKAATEDLVLRKVRETLISAVSRQMMSEVPYAVLVSGGLDSSLIASIASKVLADRKMNGSMCSRGHSFGMSKLHSFAIGLEGSPDLVAAKKVAEYLDTIHHELHFTLSEALDAVPDVIWHLESYDVTTIRASTPMYLLSRFIKAMGIKMVLSGEGSDELLGGYLYFAQAPNREEFQAETVSRVKGLNVADCLRANKSTMAWGLECRPPFLDNEVLDVLMQIDPALKMHQPGRIEKYILRKAFEGYLPEDILWRQKEQFSDGVGYSWIDHLKEYSASHVSDKDFESRAKRFEWDTPQTKEAYWYRAIFEELFGSRADVLKTVQRWIPRRDWGCPEDPSGRVQTAHLQKVEA